MVALFWSSSPCSAVCKTGWSTTTSGVNNNCQRSVRPGQFQSSPLGLGLAIEESLGSPAKQEQGSQSDRVCTENKQQCSPGNTQNGVLSRAGLM